jgi:dimeric dUTPase (all-alpha-NTP-PPase superfamily)
MHEKLVNETILEKMLILQEGLNCKYSGEDWRNTVKMSKAKFALIDEVSEFLREIETTWKWWKPNGNYHKQKALYELIDVIHFALLIVLHKNSLTDIILTMEEQGAEPSMFTFKDKEDAFNDAFGNFLCHIEHGDIDDDLVRLCNLIQAGGELLGVETSAELYSAYVMKNHRNHERVDGGILEGKYDKSKESDIPSGK